MKIVYVGLVLLCMLTLAYATTGSPSTDPTPTQATHQSGQAADGQVSNPAPSQSSHNAAILSRAEADSLSVRGDSLLAHSNVGDIKVGTFDGNDLIYVLVVVLLVVLIVAIVR